MEKNLAEPDEASSIIQMLSRSYTLYKALEDKSPLLDTLIKSAFDPDEESSQTRHTGRRPHPFNFKEASKLSTQNPWHGACIHRKNTSTVGLGFKSDKVLKALDPLCKRRSFTDVLTDVGEDYQVKGNGMMEIVRNPDGDIRGIYHLAANDTHTYREDANGRNFHFENTRLTDGTGTLKLACFGDLEDFKRRNSKSDARSEVIHFRKPTSISEDYGFPEWIAAAPFIELAQALVQHKFDFFMNRGVPEFILSVISDKKVPKADWTKLEGALNQNVGLANAFKSILWNMVGGGENAKVQLDKLGMDSEQTGEMFTEHLNTSALATVSAHGTPPLLVGIVLPGKMAAANELPNAMAAFQVLIIGPDQRIFSSTLANTLGNPELNGDLGLTEEDFRPAAESETDPMTGESIEDLDAGNGFRTILDSMAWAMKKVALQDTMSRMRETLPEAAAGGRNLGAGVLNQRRTATPGAVAASVHDGFTALLEKTFVELHKENGAE